MTNRSKNETCRAGIPLPIAISCSEQSVDSAIGGRNGIPQPESEFSNRPQLTRCLRNFLAVLVGSFMLLLTNLCPSQTVTITGDIPYAKALKGDLGDLLVWSMSQIRQDKDSTVVPGAGSVMEKDSRSHSEKLGYSSPRVEYDDPPNAPRNAPPHDPAHIFRGTLDMTGATLPATIAILVDDWATLTVDEEDVSARVAGVTGPAFHKSYEVKGTALWNPKSYVEFPVPLPTGRKYNLTLKYENIANLTKKYGGPVDVDGVSVYVCLLPVELNLRATGKLTAAPEDSSHDEILAATGTDDLGPLPMGQGRADGPGAAYCAPVEVTAKVPDLAGATWRWKRKLKAIDWAIRLGRAPAPSGTTGRLEWQATKHFILDRDDDPDAVHCDVTRSKETGKIYTHDSSGIHLDTETTNIPTIGDFLYQKKHFTYHVELNNGGGWKEVGKLDVAQRATLKRTGDATNTFAGNFLGIENSNKEEDLDINVTEAEIRAIVGGAIPIALP